MSLWTRLWAPEASGGAGRARGGEVAGADRGDDVMAMHRELLARHGVGLRSEQHLIRAGARVRVVGQLETRGPASSPQRSEAHLAVLQAQQFWRVP